MEEVLEEGLAALCEREALAEEVLDGTVALERLEELLVRDGVELERFTELEDELLRWEAVEVERL